MSGAALARSLPRPGGGDGGNGAGGIDADPQGRDEEGHREAHAQAVERAVERTAGAADPKSTGGLVDGQPSRTAVAPRRPCPADRRQRTARGAGDLHESGRNGREIGGVLARRVPCVHVVEESAVIIRWYRIRGHGDGRSRARGDRDGGSEKQEAVA